MDFNNRIDWFWKCDNLGGHYAKKKVSVGSIVMKITDKRSAFGRDVIHAHKICLSGGYALGQTYCGAKGLTGETDFAPTCSTCLKIITKIEKKMYRSENNMESTIEYLRKHENWLREQQPQTTGGSKALKQTLIEVGMRIRELEEKYNEVA